MAVYKQNNKWYCRGRINGERYHLLCQGAETKDKARELEDAYRYDIRLRQKGLAAKKEQTYTFEFMMTKYVEVCEANNKTARIAKIQKKKLCEYFGSKTSITKIKPSDIESFKLFLINRGRTKATVNRYFSAIKRAYNLMIRDDLISYNPTNKVSKFEEDNKRYRYLRIDEWNRLKSVMPKYLYSIVAIALLSGLRKSNVLQLRWEQINFELRFIEILKQNNKGKKVIRQPMSDGLYNLLQSLNPKQEGYLFVNPETNKPYTDIRKAFYSCLEKANIQGIVFHDLRRTFATWLMQEGVDIRTLQQLLMHSDISTTERYLATSHERNMNAVNKIKL